MLLLHALKRHPQSCDRKGGSLFIDATKALAYEQPQAAPSSDRWFAVRVKSNFERITATHLRQKGYLEFLPTYKTRSCWSDRIKNTEKPLFPGYVFCSFEPYRRLPILETPGVLHIVGFGKEPIPVDDLEIETIRATLRSGLLVSPWPFLQVGEQVMVERGPLAGVVGRVVQFKGVYRLVASVSLLQRSIAAEIDREWITPIRSTSSHRRSADPYM